MVKIPYNEFFEETKIESIKYIIYYKNINGEKHYTEAELNNLTEEELKKIGCLMKDYKNTENHIKSIVLFSDNCPSKIDGYYRMTEEKSLKYYGFNILYDIDIRIINFLVNN